VPELARQGTDLSVKMTSVLLSPPEKAVNTRNVPGAFL